VQKKSVIRTRQILDEEQPFDGTPVAHGLRFELDPATLSSIRAAVRHVSADRS